jgi:catechol 2,3-dioxygenase-like lactoylglutathione lyase family enzyme
MSENPPSEDWVADLSRRLPAGPAALEPDLRISSVEIYVRDQTLSRQFYVEKLGFRVVFDSAESEDEVARYVRSTGQRWIAVAPTIAATPMILGWSWLALVKPAEGSGLAGRIGSRTGVAFLAEDIAAKYKEWTGRGVHFEQAPTPVPWGVLAVFSDIDGNQFELIQATWFVVMLNAGRRAVEERQEAQRRAAYEMAVAKEVQSRLFPQSMPRLQTLSYAGRCIQARQVGGDYYDFLDLGGGRLGFVVGDVAGKGFPAALLMANLQANVRSQYALAVDDFGTMLKSVNRLFYRNTPDSSYATLFFAEYDDRSRRMRYANCGHLPPLLVHADGSVERLEATSTVLGLFRDWECATGEVRLQPGDSLVLYTDGVTEALSDRGEEFGEPRLAGLLRSRTHVDPEALLATILNAVQEFSGRDQEDDITLVVARCTAG